jgi:hypothetical protein
MPRRRSQTPSAIRSRAYRARRRNGIANFQIQTKERRLAKMLRARAYTEEGRLILEDPTKAAIEHELTRYVEALEVRWIGPDRKADF